MALDQRSTGIDRLTVVTLVVDDQAAALEWYTDVLGFEKRADDPYEVPGGGEGRWITVAAPNDDLQISLVTADPDGYDPDDVADLEAMRGRDQGWTFTTTDCRGTVATLSERGVEITREPETYPWGVQAMFADPDGNEFGLIELAA